MSDPPQTLDDATCFVAQLAELLLHLAVAGSDHSMATTDGRRSVPLEPLDAAIHPLLQKLFDRLMFLSPADRRRLYSNFLTVRDDVPGANIKAFAYLLVTQCRASVQQGYDLGDLPGLHEPE